MCFFPSDGAPCPIHISFLPCRPAAPPPRACSPQAGLIAYLVDEKQFAADRVTKAIERLKAEGFEPTVPFQAHDPSTSEWVPLHDPTPRNPHAIVSQWKAAECI